MQRSAEIDSIDILYIKGLLPDLERIINKLKNNASVLYTKSANWGTRRQGLTKKVAFPSKKTDLFPFFALGSG